MPRNDDNPRRVSITPSDLRKIRSQLVEVTEAVKTVAAAIEKAGRKSVLIDGRTMLDHGIKDCWKFVGKCEKGLREAQGEGD